MTLRARLVATLLVLAAAGLVVLAGVTYASQRSFLTERVDDQTRTVAPVIARQLEERGARPGGLPGGRPGTSGGPARGPRSGPGRPGDRPDPDAFTPPPGTYGERRDASGKRIGSYVVSSYQQTTLALPALSASLKPGELVTVGARDDSGVRYRVRAVADVGAGTTVVAIPLTGVSQTLRRLLITEAVVIGGVLLVLAAVSWLLVGIGLRPLQRMGETAGAIAGGDLARRVPDASPGTEVGRLGLALNAMLSRLEGAFAEREASEGRLRQFLADASHELRTPLASIRGYAELFRIGAATDPQDTAKAMRRIEDEAARMGVLVEDLLTLARLDEVRSTARDPVDVAALASDAAADARAREPERAITAHGDGPAFVLGDPDELRQVLANLVANALAHTPAGTAVEVTTRARDGRVRVAVRDHGAGLPDADPQALFGRFWRAEAGRGRGRAGAGLGLAIVAGIVAGHAGHLDASNAPGGGAEFTVDLPRAPEGSRDPPSGDPARGQT